jgi:DNA-binding CsgD family transcriptional regulator/tetratricopeptide (TPR) repeat protein
VDRANRGNIVGRTAELSRLDQLVAGLAAGRGGLAWVQGEPGVGKSALIDAVTARAAAQGNAVFWAAGDELMQPFPLRLMADCLGISAGSPDAASAGIAGLLRGDPGGPGALDPVMAAAEQMLELVDRRCARGPVVLAAEDLQWADEPSLLAWNRLARAVDQIPLLLIGAARPLPQRVKLDLLRELVTERAGVVIDLEPLDASSTAELAAKLANGVPGPRLQATLGRAGGNPLYVRELVDALVRDGRVEVSGDTAELHGDVAATPASLRAVVGSRLGFMPAETRKLVRMAALLGNEFDAGELAAVTGQPVAQLAGILADAIAGGVLSDTGERLRFRHELIHQILVEQTPAGIRRALHGEFARLLAEAGRPVVSVARHLLKLPGLDDWALAWLAAVPEQALFPLPQVTAELLRRAVDSDYENAARWEVLAPRLAEVLFWLGRDDEAAKVAADVVARTGNEVLAARMRIQMIRSAGRLGRPGDGLPVVVSSPGDDRLPPLWRARLGAWSALLLRDAGQPEQGAALAQDALERATASGDPLTIGYARHAAAMCRGTMPGPAPIKAALSALTGHDPESMDLRMLLMYNDVIQSMNLGLREDAEATLAALRVAERVGSFRAAAIQTAAAAFCWRYGQWDEALVHLSSIGREFLDTEPLSPQHHSMAALIALHREERDSADEHLRAAVEAAPAVLADPPVPLYPLTEALAMRAEADGDLPRAVTVMSSWLGASPGWKARDRHDDLPYLARLALAAGDIATASAAAAACQADAAADDSPGRVAAAAFCQALLRSDGGALLSVADDYRAHGWLPSCASALEEAAACLAGAGDVAGGRGALTGAVRIYAGLGATWDIRRADARLRKQGIRRGPRSSHRRVATGWAALTPSEVNIARLVGRGLSNPDIASELFLSRRTVQTHVSNILGKLELRSRVEIARAAAGQP